MNPIARLVLLALIWGGSIPVTKIGLVVLPPLTLTALRYVVAAPLFSFTLWHWWPQVRREAGKLLVAGTLNALPGQLLQSVGVGYTTSTAATLVSATIPLWFVLFSSVRLRERLQWREWGGLAAAASGVTTLVVGRSANLGDLWRGGAVTGNLLILISAVSVALYYVILADLTTRLPTIAVAGATTSVAALVLLLPGGWEVVTQRVPVSFTAVWVTLYLAVLVTFAGLQIWLGALQRLAPSVAGAMLYLQPLFGVVLSALILQEPLSLRFAFGAMLILVGIGSAGSRRERPRGEAA